MFFKESENKNMHACHLVFTLRLRTCMSFGIYSALADRLFA